MQSSNDLKSSIKIEDLDIGDLIIDKDGIYSQLVVKMVPTRENMNEMKLMLCKVTFFETRRSGSFYSSVYGSNDAVIGKNSYLVKVSAI